MADADAAAVRRALDDHYRRHPEARPSLAEVALAMAKMDGNPLADQPDLIERAAREVVAVNPNADGDDVLVQAAEMARRSEPEGAGPGVRIASLAGAWTTDRSGTDQPDWTALRAFLDYLARHPENTAAAICEAPPPSGSAFVDTLLAGIAEKAADDSGFPRPTWTAAVPPLDRPWESPGTPRMRSVSSAATPPQLAVRRIFIPASSLWRRP